MLIMGLETSCDETAVGLVDAARQIRANIVVSQLAEHQPYGGVVPEIAARAHLDHLDDLIQKALAEAKIDWGDVSAIAATCGPGLIGGVMVGAMMGKAIAAARNLPFVAVNHLEAHALTVRLTHNVAFPYLLLLVSGGHCQLLQVKGVGHYRCLGATMDDAVGECFDKGAKLLGLGYPGGPLLEQTARYGNPRAFDLPRPLVGRAGCDFSFSGLKTALRHLVARQKDPILSSQFKADAAASFQASIAAILVDRTQHALDMLAEEKQSITTVVLAGGVAANQAIRQQLKQLASSYALAFEAPPLELCTDNGVMVAWAGLERFRLGMTDGLDTATRPRWPLEELISFPLAENSGRR